MSDLHERLMRVLMGDVIAGRIRAGDPLPPAQELAAQFGVLPSVAHACLKALAERGVVTATDHAAVVNDEARWNVLDADVLTALLDSASGHAVLAEYVECRRVVETVAAGLAAERATPADLGALADALARMSAAAERASDSPAAEELYHEADATFHRALVAATQNRALEQLTAPVQRALRTAPPGALPEHQRILAAVARADADGAQRAMAEHLDTMERRLRARARDAAERPDGR
jgi:DNA-binding FadR family transcriptional regulator